jgi:hypothetical protein
MVERHTSHPWSKRKDDRVAEDGKDSLGDLYSDDCKNFCLKEPCYTVNAVVSYGDLSGI